jgi:invasion protein IalB
VSYSVFRLSRKSIAGVILLAIGCAGCAAIEVPAATAANHSSWVKLCDKIESDVKDQDGKTIKAKRNVCITAHDTIDSQTGMTMVSVGLRELEGDSTADLVISVPPGMNFADGIRVVFGEAYNKDAKHINLTFAVCIKALCTAEVEASQDTIDAMKSGGSLIVRSAFSNGQPYSMTVPLAGFATALAGKPADNQQYNQSRKQMLEAILKRRAN